MPARPLIIHVINSLTIGGAEILLKNSIHLLPEYRHLVVYLNEPSILKDQFPAEVEFVNINHGGWRSLFKTARKLRELIRDRKPLLVHSHLFEATLVARLGTPRSVPLVTTIHSTYSIDAFSKNSKSIWAEKLTLKKRHNLIGVSRFVLEDYLRFIPFSGRRYILYNFLPSTSFVSQHPGKKAAAPFQCIALGSLKEAKNYHYLLDIMGSPVVRGIELHIYGEGPQAAELQRRIENENLPVKLKGHCPPPAVFEPYDLFIQASSHEGFGLSVIEAMAAKLPMLISRIPVFEEVTGKQSHFFDLDDKEKAAAKLMSLVADAEERNRFVESGYVHCLENFSEKKFKDSLLRIYGELSQPS